MRILQVAPAWESVPPPSYGGTEAVVHVLVEELVRRGHDVTLWAAGDSGTSANLRWCVPRSLRSAPGLESKEIYAWQHCALSLAGARDYDLVHNHAGEEVMALSHLIPDVPMLTTMHCLISPERKFVWDYYRGYYNTISWAERKIMPQVKRATFGGVVYNGIDVASFPFQQEKEDYLLFLSRISMEKGPHLAVEVAKRTGRRLIIAGKVDQADYDFFVSTLAPLIDGEQVVFLGEANARMKRELYRKAYCVLMPIVWDEPFGLVMVEAQACGTPVIAFNRGAAPELIRDGFTGFVVEDVDEMAQAVHYVPNIDPQACRRHVERSFDAQLMTDNYLRLYESILRAEQREPVQPGLAGATQPPPDVISSTQVA